MKKRKHRKENGVNHRTKKNQNESVQNKSQQTEKKILFYFSYKINEQPKDNNLHTSTIISQKR